MQAEEIAVNHLGGKGTKIETAFTHLPGRVWLRVAAVKGEGSQKYGPDNWTRVPAEENIEHALRHLFLHIDGDTTEDHLAHAACRVLMAMGIGDG